MVSIVIFKREMYFFFQFIKLYNYRVTKVRFPLLLVFNALFLYKSIFLVCWQRNIFFCVYIDFCQFIPDMLSTLCILIKILLFWIYTWEEYIDWLSLQNILGSSYYKKQIRNINQQLFSFARKKQRFGFNKFFFMILIINV